MNEEIFSSSFLNCTSLYCHLLNLHFTLFSPHSSFHSPGVKLFFHRHLTLENLLLLLLFKHTTTFTSTCIAIHFSPESSSALFAMWKNCSTLQLATPTRGEEKNEAYYSLLYTRMCLIQIFVIN